MTDDIAEHVLSHNYDQTLQLSLEDLSSLEDVEAYAQFMTDLEAGGRLDRSLEALPAASAMAERVQAGKALTRPERAVLLAYGKLELSDEIVASKAPDDPYFEAVLRDYFPRALWRFEDEMRRHRLRREIIATVLDNDIVNACGPTFAPRLIAAAGCDAGELAIAFEAARRCLRLGEDWARVAALDNQAPAVAQLALFSELVRVLRGETYWFARRAARGGAGVQALIDRYQSAIDVLRELIPAVLSPFERKAAVRRSTKWIKLGAPKTLAHSFGLMRPLTYAADLGDLASASGWPLASTAYVYHRVGGQFGFDRMREAAAARVPADPYERIAVRRLIEDILAEQSALSAAVMAFAGDPVDPADAARDVSAVTAWIAAHQGPVRAARRTLEEIEASPGGWTFAKLTIANAGLRELTAA
jgi:glutamate dehydrogenase